MAEELSIKQEIYLEQVDSTSLHLHRMADADPHLDNCFVYTDFQSMGSGYASNTWESEKGRNCLFSFFISQPEVHASRQFVISKITCLAIYRVIAQLIDPKRLRIKWPNDIYVDDSKLAGVLIQHKVQNMMVKNTVIGVGLNVNQEMFVSDALNPISLKQVTGSAMDTKTLMLAILRAFESIWNDMDYREVDTLFHQVMYGLGQSRRYIYKGSELQARLIGVDEFGRLKLQSQEGIIYADFKEIVFTF